MTTWQVSHWRFSTKLKRAVTIINLFRNHFQNLSPIPKTQKVPDKISTLIVDVRMISVIGLKTAQVTGR